MFLPTGTFAKSLIRMAGCLSNSHVSNTEIPIKTESIAPQTAHVTDTACDIKKEPISESGMIKALLQSTEANISQNTNCKETRIARKREAETQLDSEPLAKVFNPIPSHPNRAGLSSPDSGWNSGDFSDSSIASPPGIYNLLIF